MARNFSIRRSMAAYTEYINDGSERLKVLIGSLHFINKEAITELMNELQILPLTRIQAATEKAEKITETLLEILHTHNRFTALLEYVRDHPGEQVPER